MNSGVVPGAINVFFSRNSVGSSTEVTHEDKGEVWIQTGVPLFSTTDNLTHGVTHALGIAQGKNGYDEVYKKGDPALVSGVKGIWNYFTGNSAEAAVNKVVNHMENVASGAYDKQGWHGERVHRPDVSKEYKILREGAKRFEKK
ncbi:MAG: hypothetical protein HC846_06820 [Blastocatellia bacterium]|nr:hypothetical protein [Blastocatellia bacterium]